MTVSKESSTPRPASQHRMSIGTAASSLPSRNVRTHSHSLSVGSINPAHRVTRRKSMSSTAANNGAVVAAVSKGSSDAQTVRRAPKTTFVPRGPGPVPNSLPSGGNYLEQPAMGNGVPKQSPTAVTDGPTLSSLPENEKGLNKARMRRASEGSQLRKSEGKRVGAGELKCEQCGKGYKHSSCLTKHLWEHTPQWQYTSKLLISKHQQVQLLEAASVLVAMNLDAPEGVKDSDHSSASPAASGSSEGHDDDSSSLETTPPPHHDDAMESYSARHSKRYSTASSAYSLSYSGNSVFSDSAPNAPGYMSHYRQWSSDGRPTTSGTSVAGSTYDDEEQADLAAAVGLLSCSYGTPKSGPVMLPPDVPPVPPLPAKFLGRTADPLSGSSSTLTAGQASLRDREYSDIRHQSRDVDMADDESMDNDDDYQRRRHSAHDDEEIGVFGRMDV